MTELTTFRGRRPRLGPPEVLTVESLPVPALQPTAIRVAVRTGRLNPVD